MKRLVLLLVLVAFSSCKDASPTCDIGGIKIPDGESAPAPIGECTIYWCEVRNNQQFLSALTCPEFAYDSRKCVKIPMNLSLQYPDCCPQVKCNDD